MADDIDFLEGNAPELPTANPMPRPRAPITPVPAPKRIETAGSKQSASSTQPAATARPRAVVPDALDREMRLDPLEDPLDALVDTDLPVPRSAPKQMAEVQEVEEVSDEDPLRSPDFSKTLEQPSGEEEIPDEDLIPVSRGVVHEETAPSVQQVPVREDTDEPPPLPYRPAAPRAAATSMDAKPSSRRQSLAEDEPPPVPTAKVRPMQVPKSEAQRVETPSLTVDRSSTPASELDMHNDLPDEPEVGEGEVGEVETESEDPKPKKGFKLPAWVVVLVVLLIAGGLFYMLLPFITKKGEPAKVAPSEIDKIVEAAEKTDSDESGENSDLENPPQEQTPANEGTPAAPVTTANGLAPNPPQGAVQPNQLPVAPTEGVPSLVPVKLDRYTLTTTMIYRPGPQQTGPVQQLGVFDDGGREIYVAKIMYGPNDLQGPSRFLAKVQNLADSSLNSSLKKGSAVLNGPSALNNARVPASIYSITETRTDAAGMEVREMKTYMIVDADDGCLVFAVQTPDSDTGYGLTKFIEMSSQLE